MRTLDQLVETNEPAWPLIRAWCRDATNENRILSTFRGAGEDTLLRLQVTSRSPMGAVALETGGIIVDHGWVRVLGAAGVAMKEGLIEWNKLQAGGEFDYTVPNARIIGHDATGGFFALNGGKWPDHLGGVYYWGQDSLEWTSLETTYSGWLQWVLNGDLGRFYESLRWPGWQDEIAALSPDQGVSIYPFPWAEDGGAIASRSRRAVPMRELWDVSNNVAAQIRDLPSRSQVDIQVTESDDTKMPT